MSDSDRRMSEVDQRLEAIEARTARMAEAMDDYTRAFDDKLRGVGRQNAAVAEMIEILGGQVAVAIDRAHTHGDHDPDS